METQIKQCNCLKETENEKYARISEIIHEYKDKKGSLIQVLHLAQGIFGYLPSELQEFIAEGLNIPLPEVYGVVTFYTQFSLKPKGKFKIQLCLGTACYVKGADKILEKLKEKLGILVGESTEDGRFSLDACRCIGACGLAPVIMINDEVYGRLDPEDIGGIIEKYKLSDL